MCCGYGARLYSRHSRLLCRTVTDRQLQLFMDRSLSLRSVRSARSVRIEKPYLPGDGGGGVLYKLLGGYVPLGL